MVKILSSDTKNNIIKFFKNNILIFIFFIFLIIIFFFRMIFIDKTCFFVSDIQLDFITQLYSASLMQQGILPLWDPYYYGPFVAYFASAVFYPFNIIIQFLFNLGNLNLSFRIFEFLIIFHYFLSALFMYFLMRTLKASKAAALLSAITYSFGGFMVGRMIHVQMLYAASYAPLLFLFIVKAFNTKTFYIILAGLVLGIMFLAGHPQPAIYYCFIILIFLIYESLCKGKQSNSIKRFLKPLKLYFICMLFALGISAIQIFPIFEFIPYGHRATTTYEQMFNLGSITPAHLIHLLMPNFFGGRSIPYWGLHFENIGMHETSYYMGIHALIFLSFIIFFTRKKRPYISFFLIISLISLFLMLGRYTIFSSWLYLIPGLSKVRIASRLASIFNFFSAILVGYGLDTLKEESIFINQILNKFRKLIFIIPAIIMGWLCIFWINLFKHQNSLAIYDKLLNAYNSFGRFAILFLLFMLAIILYLRLEESFKKFAIGFIILVSVIDLFSYGIGFYPRAAFPYSNSKQFTDKQIASLSSLKSLSLPDVIINDKDIYRIRMQDLYEAGRYFSINKLFSLGYGGAVAIKRLSYFRRIFENPEPMYNIIDPASPLIDFYNVKYLYSNIDLRNYSKKYEAVNGYSKWYINKNAFPRAFCVLSYTVIKEEDRILAALDQIDLKKYVILEEIPKHIVADSDTQLDATSKIIKYSNNEIDILVDSKSPTFVVLSDLWYPGWVAFIDDRPVKIYRADYAFRAVYSPVGQHKIKFAFRPFSLRLGMLVSLFTIIFIISFVVFSLKRK